MHGRPANLAALAIAMIARQESPSSAPAAKAPAVCVSRMQITKTVALYEDPRMTPTGFEFELFVNPGKGREIAQYSVRIVSLDPIEDDTGKPLLTPERRKENRALHETIPYAEMHLVGDTMGPVLPIRLDVPSAAAKQVRRVHGALEVAEVEVAKIEFKNVRRLDGRRLEHADLEDVDVRARLDPADPKSISLVFGNGRPRVKDWAIARGDEFLRPAFRAASDPGDPANELTYGFDDAIPEDASLWIAVAKTAKPQTVAFDFEDVPLP